MTGYCSGGRFRAPGFTLMETLVMLVLVSFSVLLMFQMLGTYRVARERFVARGADIDREALFSGWFADSIGGLHAVDGQPLDGGASSFSAVTLNPLLAQPGAPVPIQWTLEPAPVDGGWSVVYSEAGEVRWTLPLATPDVPSFVYLDQGGAVHETWPPALGVQRMLPQAIALIRGSIEGGRVQVAAVRGPLDPVYAPYQLEQE